MSHSEFVHGKAFYPTVDALSDEIASLLEAGDVDSALSRIQVFVQDVIFDRRSVAKVFASSELDAWCQRIGAELVEQIASGDSVTGAEPVDCVILATELYRAGGHTAVMEDLVRTGRFGPHIVVVLTDVLNSADSSIIAERFGPSVTGETAPAGSFIEKLRWTIGRLLALRPRRLVLFNHPDDSVSIAAAQPGLAEETVFYHHADHQLCLGVTLSHTLHVDPHPMGFHHCRDTIGVHDNVYWPLVVADQGAAIGYRIQKNLPSGLRTCSSGSNNKFETDYRYQYADVLPRILSTTQGTHLHIGPLSDDMIGRIRAGLDAQHIEQARFVHLPWVRSVWKTLVDHQIDLYIASFPLGGGRVVIEAMGAGVPIIAHDCYRSRFLGGKDMLYPNAFVWRRPEILLAHLAQVERQQLLTEGRIARDCYERYHTDAALVGFIDAGRAAQDAPPLRPHVGDPMQEFLDDVRYALRDRLTAGEVEPVFALNRHLKHEIERERTAREIVESALSQDQSRHTLALMQLYSDELAQLGAALDGEREQGRATRSHLHRIETSRSWRLALRLQRVVSMLRG